MRSGTSLCYTAWEVYVEEALLDTVRQLTDERAPNDLPDVLRRWVEQQQPSPWSFTGDAWKAEVVELAVREVRGDGQGRFGLNTANVPHVTALYKNVLGCTPLQVVHWQRKANPTVRRDIQALVRVRGEIVHQGKTPDTLTLAKVRYWANFVQRLCEKFEEQLVAFRDNVGLF